MRGGAYVLWIALSGTIAGIGGAGFSALYSGDPKRVAVGCVLGLLLGTLGAAIGSVLWQRLSNARVKFFGRWLMVCLAAVAVGIGIQAMRSWSPPGRFRQVMQAEPPFAVLAAEGNAGVVFGFEHWGFLLDASDEEVRRFADLHLKEVQRFERLDEMPSFHGRLSRGFGFVQPTESRNPDLAMAGVRDPFLIGILRPAPGQPVQLIVFKQFGFKIGD